MSALPPSHPTEARPVCPACGTVAAPDARFCEECGAVLPVGPAAVLPPPPAAVLPAGPAAVLPPPPVAPLPPAAVALPPAAVALPPAAAALRAAAGLPAIAVPALVPVNPVPATSVPATPADQAPASPAASCVECGGVIDADGYCTSCGAKAGSPRDHVVEQPQAWVGGVSDRGARRRRNEDALALAATERAGEFAALVVCDGVASARDSDVASLAAAQAARDVLDRSRATAASEAAAWGDASAGARLTAAAEAANGAVIGATRPDHDDSPPSCTFVAVLLEHGRIAAGVVGDSRAYWLPDAGEARQLTSDDSLAAELVAAGMPREEAEAGPFAHTITRWLGVDSPGHVPRVTEQAVDGPGWLLACSDGLWNYCSAPADLAGLVRERAAAASQEPLATAAALVDWANGQGGHDNITVALARLGPGNGAGPGATTEG